MEGYYAAFIHPTIEFSSTTGKVANSHSESSCTISGLSYQSTIIDLKVIDEYGSTINIDVNTIQISGENYKVHVDITSLHDGLIYAKMILDSNSSKGIVRIQDTLKKDTTPPIISVQSNNLENPIIIKGRTEQKFTEVQILLVDFIGFRQNFTTITDENGSYIVTAPKRIYDGIYNIQASIVDDIGNIGIATSTGYLSREIDERSLMQHYENISTARYQSGRISPGVVLRKRKIVTTSGYPVLTAISGFFEQGPQKPMIINSKEEFINYFGLVKTIDSISCEDFLDFSTNLLVQRVLGPNSFNAYAIGSKTYKFDHPNIRINSKDDLENVEILSDEFIRVFARDPGKYGNKVKVAIFTQDQVKYNEYITETVRAQDIVQNIPYLCYCVVVFLNDEISEVHIVKINDLTKINDLSDQIYVKTNISSKSLHVYDGNLIFADGDLDIYRGGYDLYDGSVGSLDGNVCIIDGNNFNPLFCVPTFFGFNILELRGGFTDYPSQQEFNDKEILENTLNFDIDIFIGNNTILERDDIVNIVPTPYNTKKALDFVDNFGIIKDIPNINKITNIMFINGYKRDSKFLIPLAGQYAGLRADIMIKDISESSSKVTVPFKNDDILEISLEDQELLYEYGINSVVKFISLLSKPVWYCNGEKMFKKI